MSIVKPRTAPRKKVKSVQKLKKDLWKLLSPFIRRRDADENGMVKCCSCDRWLHWKQGDAGHFIDGRHNSIVFDIRNIHFQCKPCNGGFSNQKYSKEEVKANYEAFMVKRYGKEVVAELKTADKKRKEWSTPELLSLIETYKQKL